MKQIDVFSPEQVSDDNGTLSEYNIQLLAQGDSWFAAGALPAGTTNLFDGMGTTDVQACAVNCARSGAELALMTNTTRAAAFLQLLNGRAQRRWSGLLLSGGGNDLIAAVQQAPTNAAAKRLLATQREWTDALGGDRYLSNAGWKTFATHLTAVFQTLLAARDKGDNRGIPVVMHSYDYSTPRNVGAGLGIGPWLYPAMVAYGIPIEDWPAVSVALLNRLQTLLHSLASTTADGSVHLIQSLGTLVPAPPAKTNVGPTTDWQNEIHPTATGYRKLSAKWRPVLDSIFASRVA